MKPTTDEIYVANDVEDIRRGIDPESQETASLNTHHSGDPDSGCIPRHHAPWVKRIDPAYLTAGEAEIHVQNPKGDEVQFRIRKVENERGLIWFVDANTAPIPGEPRWEYLGVFNPDAVESSEVLFLTRTSRFAPGDLATRAFRYFLIPVLYHVALPDGYRMRHGGRCPRCGRLLSSGKSLRRGIGPRCRKVNASS